MEKDQSGASTAQIEIDIDDSLGGASQSLWVAFRGNGQSSNLVATLDYYDLGGNLIGSESFSETWDGSTNGDRGLGLGSTPSGFPEYDQIVVGSAFNSTPMSRAVLSYDAGGPSSAFYMDEVIVSPEPSTMLLLTLGGLAALRRRCA